MSDVDVSAEAVKRVAGKLREYVGCYNLPGTVFNAMREADATLRALRAALDAAEDSIATLTNSEAELMAGCDDLEAERDAALAARDAAWRAGRDAAAALEDCGCTHRENCSQGPYCHALRAQGIRAAQPPADLAAEAPGDAVALLEAAESLLATVTVLRGRYPDDEDTHAHEEWAMDELDKVVAAIKARAGA